MQISEQDIGTWVGVEADKLLMVLTSPLCLPNSLDCSKLWCVYCVQGTDIVGTTGRFDDTFVLLCIYLNIPSTHCNYCVENTGIDLRRARQSEVLPVSFPLVQTLVDEMFV